MGDMARDGLRQKIKGSEITLTDVQRATGLTYNRIQQGLTGVVNLSTREMAIIEAAVDVLVKSRRDALCRARELLKARATSGAGLPRRRTRKTFCAAKAAAGAETANTAAN